MKFSRKSTNSVQIISKNKRLNKEHFEFLFVYRLKEMLFHTEDCNFVVEGIPSEPYHCHPNDFVEVELNMKLRRASICDLLDVNECMMSISLFPRLGCIECTYPSYKTDPKTSFEKSISCPDQFKTPNHPRTMFVFVFEQVFFSLCLFAFRFLNRNVIERRQDKVAVNVPSKKNKTNDLFEL